MKIRLNTITDSFNKKKKNIQNRQSCQQIECFKTRYTVKPR